MVELFDHVSIHLNVVSFGLYITNFLLVKLQIGLQLRSDHLQEFVVGLLLLLGLSGRHSSRNDIYITSPTQTSNLVPAQLFHRIGPIFRGKMLVISSPRQNLFI